MILLAVLVFAGALILIVVPTHRLTPLQIACAAFGLFILRAGGLAWTPRPRNYRWADADSRLLSRDTRLAGNHRAGHAGMDVEP
jgi:hypothetical protein